MKMMHMIYNLHELKENVQPIQDNYKVFRLPW